MKFDKKDCSIRWSQGQGAGGQHRNKTENCCNLTHIPTGVEVREDGRSRRDNLRVAYKELEKLVIAFEAAKIAAAKKEERDYKIHNTETIRTYHYSRQTVKDHRTGKTAPLKKFMDGKIDLKDFSNE